MPLRAAPGLLRRPAARRLKVTTARYDLLVDRMGDGVIGVDTTHAITYANPAACRALGFGEHELIGWNVHERLHGTRRDGTVCAAEACPFARLGATTSPG